MELCKLSNGLCKKPQPILLNSKDCNLETKNPVANFFIFFSQIFVRVQATEDPHTQNFVRGSQSLAEVTSSGRLFYKRYHTSKRYAPTFPNDGIWMQVYRAATYWMRLKQRRKPSEQERQRDRQTDRDITALHYVGWNILQLERSSHRR